MTISRLIMSLSMLFVPSIIIPIHGFLSRPTFISISETRVTGMRTVCKLSDINPSEYYRPGSRQAPQGGDMAYIEANVRRAASTFQSIRKVGGSECSNDMYARNADSNQFWFIGKIARCDGTVTLRQAVSKQWNLMEEHACRLRPVELGREFGKVEIWAGRGDSELEYSQGVDNCNLLKMNRFVDIDGVSTKEIGLILEVVTNSGEGYYIERDDEGRVVRNL